MMKNVKDDWSGESYFTETKSSFSKGVGILFAKKIEYEILDLILCKDERKLLLNIKINDSFYTFVNIYAPNSENERIEFFENLIDWVRSNAKFIDKLITCGDWNCCFYKNARSTNTHRNDKSRASLKLFLNAFSLLDVLNENDEKACIIRGLMVKYIAVSTTFLFPRVYF